MSGERWVAKASSCYLAEQLERRGIQVLFRDLRPLWKAPSFRADLLKFNSQVNTYSMTTLAPLCHVAGKL